MFRYACAIIIHRKEFRMVRRGRLWHFPGIRIQPGERDLEQKLSTYLRRNLSLTPTNIPYFAELEQQEYNGQRGILRTYWCSVEKRMEPHQYWLQDPRKQPGLRVNTLLTNAIQLHLHPSYHNLDT